MAQFGRRGSLKNCIVKVRVLLPALMIEVCGCGAIWQTRRSQKPVVGGSSPLTHIDYSVGVAQLEERERATLEAGSSNLLADFCCLNKHAWPSGFQAQGRSPCQDGSIPSACSKYLCAEVAKLGKRAELKPPSIEGSTPSFCISGFSCGGASARLGLISLDSLGALPRPAISYGALGKAGYAVSFSS